MNKTTNRIHEESDDERERREGQRARHPQMPVVPGRGPTHSNKNYPTDEFGNAKKFDPDHWAASGVAPTSPRQKVEKPVVGDVIRTKRTEMEGKVVKVSPDGQQIVFQTEDGRTLKVPYWSVTVITKLADCDKPMMEQIFKEVLTKYKKETTNEAKFEYSKKTGKMEKNDADPDQRHGLYLNGKLSKTYNTKEEAKNVKARDPKYKTATIKKIAEGIVSRNFCEDDNDDDDHLHPTDYFYMTKSYAGMLDGMMHEVQTNSGLYQDASDEQIKRVVDLYNDKENMVELANIFRNNGIGAGINFFLTLGPTTQNFLRTAWEDHGIDVEADINRFGHKGGRPHLHEKKFVEGSMGGINRVPNLGLKYDKVLDEVKNLWAEEKKTEGNVELTEISKGEKKRQADAAKHAASEKARLEREAKTAADKAEADRIAKKHANREKKIGKKFGDLIQKQHQQKQAEQPPEPKKEPVTIPFHGWDIKYRPASTPGEPVEWIIVRNGNVRHKGQSASDKEAVGAAEEWIRKGAGQSGKFKSNATIDFNKKFVDEFAPNGETFWATNVSKNGEPHFVFSQEPYKGLQKSSIRAGTNFPSISEKPTAAQGIGLLPHGRYILDIDNSEELEGTPGIYIFPLIFQGIIQDKSERMHMPGPGFTVAHPRDKGGVSVAGDSDDVDEDIDPWHGDNKFRKPPSRPDMSMQGVPGVPFSELVQDTIKSHGVKWAFDYYVKKKGLPPRQFQIFAGLVADPPKKARAKGDWTDPSISNRPKPKQSWWKNLLGKLE